MDNSQVSTFPDTVTVLNAPNGSVLYIVGTSNLIDESEEHVAQVINAVKPDSVILQIANNLLSTDQANDIPVIAFETLKLGCFKDFITEYGFVRGIFDYVLMNFIENRWRFLSKVYGGKFRRAIDEAKKYNSSVYFADRPVDKTIKRSVTMMTWTMKIRLLSFMLLTEFKIKRNSVEQLKNKDLLDILMLKMSADFPVMKKIMDLERCMFLTHILQASVGMSVSPYYDSIIYSRPRVVVAVVESSHVANIMRYWKKMSLYYVLYVLLVPPLSEKSKDINMGINLFIIGLLFWGLQVLGVKLLPILMFHYYVNTIQ